MNYTQPKLWVAILLTIGFLSACTDQDEILQEPIQEVQEQLMTRQEIDKAIINSLQTSDEFNWNQASDRMLWSALLQGDSILTIGYKPTDESDISKRMANIDISQDQWKATKNEVLTEIVDLINAKNGSNLRVGNLSYFAHDVLPFFEIKVTDIEVISKIRSREDVRYAEPLGYEVDFGRGNTNVRTTSDSGCDSNYAGTLPSSDYHVVTPNAKVSWNYAYMNIEQAWNYSTGDNIGVGLIDTGISPNQNNLNGAFSSGLSTNRFIQKYGTYVNSIWWWGELDGPDDQCGHGTAMAGTIAAPRGSVGASVGVAYNANLVAYRGTGDVVINASNEKTGVADALVGIGNRSDVRIISMSIGDVFSNSKVADAIRYAYGKGKLIFAAAGTSTNFTNWYGVIFPATMSETVAVTGIKEGSYNKCDVCHSGSKVDFTIVMERAGSNTKPLTLAMSGNAPSTVGGSSVATATAAGIAALVWAKNPSWTRDQVLNKLKQTADLYPNKSSEYGWGTLNALAAVQ
ncbi:S8 family serine peptidase [Limibacter armeniacum]|uniref:S8 family peptidase n=1 Tax=Limibacter armeniacum TaxID=466084 RepID=UPI002FE65F7B